MEHDSIVYGYIRDIRVDPLSEEGLSRRLANRKALLRLPPAEEGTLLHRDMFIIPPEFPAKGIGQTTIIHFGVSCPGVEYEWEAWISRFEELLSDMYWVDVTLHLETEMLGKHTFTWESDSDFHAPSSGQDMSVRCEWSREGLLS